MGVLAVGESSRCSDAMSLCEEAFALRKITERRRHSLSPEYMCLRVFAWPSRVSHVEWNVKLSACRRVDFLIWKYRVDIVLDSIQHADLWSNSQPGLAANLAIEPLRNYLMEQPSYHLQCEQLFEQSSMSSEPR